MEDSGPGIPADDRPQLFDRFHRADDDGNGTGLGLAIGDSVVRSTGGRWQVGDSPLGGARMARVLAARPAAPAARVPPGRGPRHRPRSLSRRLSPRCGPRTTGRR